MQGLIIEYSDEQSSLELFSTSSFTHDWSASLCFERNACVKLLTGSSLGLYVKHHMIVPDLLLTVLCMYNEFQINSHRVETKKSYYWLQVVSVNILRHHDTNNVKGAFVEVASKEDLVKALQMNNEVWTPFPGLFISGDLICMHLATRFRANINIVGAWLPVSWVCILQGQCKYNHLQAHKERSVC